MKTRIFLIIAALISQMFLLGLIFVNSEAFRKRLQYEVVSRLDRLTGAKFSIERVQVRFFPLRIQLTHLIIPGSGNPLDPPFLSIQRVEARPILRSLFGSLELRNLDLFEPRINIEVRSDGSNNLPIPQNSFQGMNFLHLSAEKLKIFGGLLQFREHRVGLSSEIDHFTLLANYDYERATYRAHLAYQNGRIQLGKGVWSYGLDVVAQIGSDVRVEELTASIGDSKLQMQGVFKGLKFPEVALSYQGRLDPLMMKTLFPQLRAGFGLVSCEGKFNYAAGGWRTQGILEGRKLALDTVKINYFSTQFDFAPTRFSFEKIKIQGMHGWAEGRLDIESPFASRLYRAELRLQRVGLLDLSLLAGLDRLAFGGFLNGEIKASWRDRWENFVGESRLSIAEAAEEEQEHRVNARILPLSGHLNFSLTSRSSSFGNSYLRLGHTTTDFAGVLSADQGSNLHLQLKSEDLQDIGFFIPGLRGTATFSGTLQGSLTKPNVSGSFVASQISYQTFFFDNLSGQLEADRTAIRLSQTTATRARSKLLAEGTVFLGAGESSPPGAVQLRLQVKDAHAVDLFALLGTTFPTSGLISGSFAVIGHYPQLEVQGVAHVREGMFFDQPYDSGQFDLRFLDPLLSLHSFSVTLGTGRVNGSAEINLKENTVESRLTAHALPLDRIKVLSFRDNPITGTLRDLQIKARGDFRRPALDGSFSITDSRVAGELMGNFGAEFETQDQILKFALSSFRPAIKLRAEGALALNEACDLNAKLTFENFVLSPYVKKLLPVVPETLNSQADGQISISGPLRYPLKLIVDGTLKTMKISFRESQVQASKPFAFQYRDQKVLIKDALFSGKGTTLSVDGSVDLSSSQRLGLEMKGDFDLALLNEFEKKLRSSGNGRVDAAIRGTLNDPRIQGHGEILNGQFSYGDFPNSLSQVTANLFFDEDQISIRSLSGTSGGGQISLRGDLFFTHETVKMVQLQAEAREVRVRYPEGMRSVVNADLTLHGSAKSQQLSGNVRLLSATFQKGYDPITAFLENRKNNGLVIGGGNMGSSLSLNLNVTGDRGIKLDTPLMKVTSSADLQIKGTALNPLLTGRIEADSGELYFQGVRYRITRGRIDFVNSVRFEPHFDLEAETDVRDYRVILTLNGTLDKFKADLHSDPPLSNFDLFSLISSGGATATGARGSVSTTAWRPYSTTGTQQDNSLGAQSVLSEGLSLKVGSRFKRIFGLDRFRVDPFLLGNERDQAARVTFGQQVTKEVSITYSASFSSNDQQVIIVEYSVNDNTSIIASRDAEGAFGLDIRFRKRLRQKNH
jgi:translocation and assembly module TamB